MDRVSYTVEFVIRHLLAERWRTLWARTRRPAFGSLDSTWRTPRREPER